MPRKSQRTIDAESGLRQLNELAAMNKECRELEGQREAHAQLRHFTPDANRWLAAVRAAGWSDQVPLAFRSNAVFLTTQGWRFS